mgnify:FL=1
MMIGQRQEMRLVFSREFSPKAEGFEIKARFTAFLAKLEEQASEHPAAVLLVRLTARVEDTTTAFRPFPETVTSVHVRLLDDWEDPSAGVLLAAEDFRMCESNAGPQFVAAYKAEKAEQDAIREADKAQRK